MKARLFTDGGARGNPGPAAYGFVLEADDGTVLDDGLKKLADAKKPLDNFFISYASYNDDRAKGALFGANLKVAPPSKSVAKLIDDILSYGFGIILRDVRW